MNRDIKATPCKVTGWINDAGAAGEAKIPREALLNSDVCDLVQGAIPLGQQVLAYKKIVERLRQIIFYDPLTNLPSWRLFNEQLAVILERAKDSRHSFAVLFFDIDRFRNVNYAFGHEAGDRLLSLFAERIGAVLDSDSILSRKGGDRFFLLLPKVTGDKEIETIVASMMAALREPFCIEGQEVFLTISIGITRYPQGGDDAVSLLKNADAAMNKAKEAGRNTSRFFCDALHAKASRQLQLENLLRKALEKNEFSLHYQPQYRMSCRNDVDRSGLMHECISNQMIGCEALLRWNNAELGNVSPAEFIPIAEATGMIESIGEWVIREVCTQVRQWQDAGVEPFRVAINLSPRQLFNPNFEVMVYRMLRESKLDPCWLEMEVTENILMLDIREATEKLNQLRNMGVKISVDDFGTGYSSLSYLKKLPIDSLKIDRSFVQDLERCPDSTAIVQAIISMAKQLKLSVIAEGVETEEQATFLAGNGCTDLQGYFFNRPLSAKAFTAYLMSSAEHQQDCCPSDILGFYDPPIGRRIGAFA
ncbi:hypothetical protein A7E78_07920 [Syntrophotalea acetylenivorans]|uniref:Diguanylate cyclase n=1 Tax=Syntrophotalea acetylenivorans TaxID=1842532 RepID=A0A1L3GQ16_9BACT|nr:EAL domain-containing protein [Syntrophotalea acetylenivorans]APG27768.1 hypothetical protein A7E78_07920 [Syntrophotalea acetylenivorans]